MYRESNKVAWHENINQSNGTLGKVVSGDQKISSDECIRAIRKEVFVFGFIPKESPSKSPKSFIAACCFVLFFIVLNLCPHPGRVPDSLYLHHTNYTPDPMRHSSYSFFIISP